MPFLVGIHSSYLKKRKDRRPGYVVFVNLDDPVNPIIPAVDNRRDPWGHEPALPAHTHGKLKKALGELVGRELDPGAASRPLDLAFPSAVVEPVTSFASTEGVTQAVESKAGDVGADRWQGSRVAFPERQVREAFLRALTALFLKYADYVREEELTSGTALTIDMERWLASMDAGSRPFCKEMAGGQCFERFLEDKLNNRLKGEVRPAGSAPSTSAVDEPCPIPRNASPSRHRRRSHHNPAMPALLPLCRGGARGAHVGRRRRCRT